MEDISVHAQPPLHRSRVDPPLGAHLHTSRSEQIRVWSHAPSSVHDVLERDAAGFEWINSADVLDSNCGLRMYRVVFGSSSHPNAQDYDDACEREGPCLSRSLQLRGRVGLAPLEYHLLLILLLRAITKSRRRNSRPSLVPAHAWQPSVAIRFIHFVASSTLVAGRDIPGSDSGAARALGLWRCLFNPERRLWRARIPTISGFCCRSRTETHEALPADRLGVGVRVSPPQQQAPMLVPKLHAPHADSAHVQPPVIILFIA
ncbi:hypothetical protein B0H14DRAFT_3519187 [Mycena olivaceomarginata]|nr:hypothetical protein B0H14DRAFT_3519187 [Mycena olivaceomarginata]